MPAVGQTLLLQMVERPEIFFAPKITHRYPHGTWEAEGVFGELARPAGVVNTEIGEESPGVYVADMGTFREVPRDVFAALVAQAKAGRSAATPRPARPKRSKPKAKPRKAKRRPAPKRKVPKPKKRPRKAKRKAAKRRTKRRSYLRW